MTSPIVTQTTAINILPDISNNKGNLTIKCGQLVTENYARKIFLPKSCRK